MQTSKRMLVGSATVAMATLLAACGSSGSSNNASTATTAASGGSSSTSAGAVRNGGTLKVLQGTYPDSLDPQYGYTTQAAEADSVVYNPLLGYAHKQGLAGTQLIPDLATALPTVSANGLTYTMTLRKGLVYSNGTPVKASDFAFAIERAIKISWGGDSFYTQYIAGATAYQKGTASTISGIVSNDTTGVITVTLTQAYGAFDNVLAFPSSAPVPSTTPMTVQSATPPVGVGPYIFTKVVPNVSYTLVKNPHFAGLGIPGIPTGHVSTIDVTVQSNTTTEAQQVLTNQADVFDPGDTIPASLLSQIQSQASNRYQKKSVATVYYFFLNTQLAPFNNIAAREAVNLALDRTALARLASGFVTPGCFFLPPSIPGHPTGPCPYGNPNQVPSAANIAKAKALVKNAGLAGSPVTVWSETRSPRLQYCEYLQGVLNQIGFKASLKVIQDSVYFQTIGNAQTKAQTGFADWSQDFPNPSDFYLLFSKAAIQPVNNENFSNVNDPHIEAQLAKLDPVPAPQLSSVASQWAALDTYVAQKAYVAAFGYNSVPKFLSNRVDFSTAVFNPVTYMDWSTIALK